MSTVQTPITYEQSLTLPENHFEEIVQGVSRIMPPASLAHDRLLRRLDKILEAQLSGRGYQAQGPGVGLGISRVPFTYRLPDKMVVSSKASQESDDPLYIWESPILVVECLSPANRKGDVAELIADYRNAGVPEVWLLKPEEVTCVIYTGLSLSTVTTQDVGIVNLGQLAQVPMLMLWQAWAGE